MLENTIKTLTIDDYKFAEEVLGETAEKRETGIQEILQWYDDNPKINGHRDRLTILYFLRGAKFNIEKAKKKIKSHYRMRAERLEWFEERDPFNLKLVELLDIGVFLPLKQRDANNRLVVIIRTAAHNPKIHSQNDVFKIGKMILDFILTLDESISVHGVVAIFDMAGVGLGHALQMTPPIIKRSAESWENYPCRTKHLEFVNAPRFLNTILNIFKSFMSTKMKSRISVSKVSVCTAELPTDLGGKGESYEELAIYWKKVLQENKEWFINDEKFKSILN